MKKTTKSSKPATKKKPVTRAAATSEPKAPRADSKKAIVIALLGRTDGVQIGEIMKATGWQKHTVRGFLSILGKTTPTTSATNDAGERVYKLA